MNRGVLERAEIAIQNERITGRGSEKGRITESEPRITGHGQRTMDPAKPHWPNKAISSQGVGAQEIIVGVASDEAESGQQLRIAVRHGRISAALRDFGLRNGD